LVATHAGRNGKATAGSAKRGRFLSATAGLAHALCAIGLLPI
jgi:hypothetical protein